MIKNVNLAEINTNIATAFHYCKNVFTHVNIWMIWKNSIKLYYLKKKDFYSHLNTKDITDADYAHAKKDCKDYRMKHLGKHHDLYVQSNTLLLADVF